MFKSKNVKMRQPMRVITALLALFSLFFVSFGATAFASSQGPQSGEQPQSSEESNNALNNSTPKKAERTPTVKKETLNDKDGDTASFRFIQPATDIVSGDADYQDFDIWYKGLKTSTVYEISMPENIVLTNFIVAGGSIIESVDYKCLEDDCWGVDYSTLLVKTKDSYSGSLVEGTFGASFENQCRVPGTYNFNWDTLNGGLVVNSNWSINFTLGDNCLEFDNSVDKTSGRDLYSLGTVFADGEWNGVVSGLDLEVDNTVVIGSKDGGVVTAVDSLPTGWTYKNIYAYGVQLASDGTYSKWMELKYDFTVVDNQLTVKFENVPEYTRITLVYDAVINGGEGFKTIISRLAPDTFFCIAYSDEVVRNTVRVLEFDKEASDWFMLDYGSTNGKDENGRVCIPWDNTVSIEGMTTEVLTDSGQKVTVKTDYTLNISYDWLTEDMKEELASGEYDHNWIAEDDAYLNDGDTGQNHDGVLKVVDGKGFTEVPYSEEAWDNFDNDEYVGNYMIRPAHDAEPGYIDPAKVRFNLGRNLVDNYSFKLQFVTEFEGTLTEDCDSRELSVNSSASFGFVVTNGWGMNSLGRDFAYLYSYYMPNQTCITVVPNYISLPISEPGIAGIEVVSNITRDNPSITVHVDPAVLDIKEITRDNVSLYLSGNSTDDFGNAKDINIKKIGENKLDISFAIPESFTDSYYIGSLYIDSVVVKALDYKGKVDSEVNAYSYSQDPVTLRSQGSNKFTVSTLANELSVDKWVSPAGKEDWTKTLDLGSNPASNNIDYLLDFSSNNDFKELSLDIVDTLPANFTFEGFIVDGKVVAGNSITVSGINVVYENGAVIVKAGEIENVKDLKVMFRGGIKGTEPIVNTVLDSTTVVTLSEKGSVTWNKVNPTGNLLGGSSFILTGPNGYSKTVSSSTGVFVVDNLDFGSYELKESKAPAGYILNETVYEFTVDEEDKVIDLGNIVNKPETPIVTPLDPTLKKNECDVKGTVIIPEVEGVIYETSTNRGIVTVTAKAAEGYKLKDGAKTKWSFDITPDECPKPDKPKPPKPEKYDKTGESTVGNILGVAGIGLLAIGGITYAIVRRRI